MSGRDIELEIDTGWEERGEGWARDRWRQHGRGTTEADEGRMGKHVRQRKGREVISWTPVPAGVGGGESGICR